jgi:hypothetical protein
MVECMVHRSCNVNGNIMINEIVNDYVEYLKVDLTKEVILHLWFITLNIASYHILITEA